MSILAITLVSVSVAFVAGWVASKAYFAATPQAAQSAAPIGNENPDGRRTRYERRFKAMQKLVERQERHRSEIRERLARVQRSLEDRNRAIEGLRSEVDAQRAQARSLDEELSLMRIERDELAARASRVPPSADSEYSEIHHPNRRKTDALRAEMGGLRETLAASEHRAKQLEAKLHESRLQHERAEIQIKEWKRRIQPLSNQIRRQRDVIRSLKEIHARNDAIDVTTNNQGVTDDLHAKQPDDLKRIRGIGPALERRLQAHGISRYAQIAELDPDQLARIAAKIAVASNLPRRDNWIEQAKSLIQQG